MNQGTSSFLNASRWIAAFFVVLGHVSSVSAIDYYDVTEPTLVLQGVYFLGGFGHIAVIVFFVVSGYLVGGRTIVNFQARGFNIRDYYAHRFARIYVVLIPALIVGYTIDSAGILLFNGSTIYTHPEQFDYYNRLGNDITQHLSLRIFIGNLMQLQDIYVSTLGSNAPLWSLANEWWYYVFFGFCMKASCSRRVLTRIIAGSAIIAMVIVLPLTISLWFVLWAIGAGVAVLDRYWEGWPFFAGATIMVVCLGAARWTNQWQAETGMAARFVVDLAVALGYSIALVCAKNSKRPRKLAVLHRFLASFSYTTYLVHFPAMVFLAALLNDVFGIEVAGQPSVGRILYGGVLLGALYGYSWIFSVLTEAHTNTIRSRLRLLTLRLGFA